MSIGPFLLQYSHIQGFCLFLRGGEYGDDIIYNQLAFWFIKFINCREEMKGRKGKFNNEKEKDFACCIDFFKYFGGGYAKLIKYWHSMNAIISHTLNI